MKGSIHFTIGSRWINYDITLSHNVTFIVGDSATGKTSLVSMLEEYLRKTDLNLKTAGLDELDIRILTGTMGLPAIKASLSSSENALIIADETFMYLDNNAFLALLRRNLANYYLFIIRDASVHNRVTFSSDALMELAYNAETNTNSLVPWTQELNKRGYYWGDIPVAPDRIVTEDKGAGFEFYNRMFPICESAKDSKSAFIRIAENVPLSKTVLFIADGAAFGSNLLELASYISSMKLRITLYLPLSFEWVLLHSPIFDISPLKHVFNSIGRLLQNLYGIPVKDILKGGVDYIDSKVFLTEERFYFTLLRYEAQIRGFNYDKMSTNSVLFRDDSIRGILLLCLSL